MEGETVRKTKYFKDRGKGIFGHLLSYFGTVEDHQKGTLHYHVILYGGVSPYVLQRLSRLQDICDSVSSVLGTFFRAKMSQKCHARHLIHRILRKSNNIGLKTKDITPLTAPGLLKRYDPINEINNANGTSIYEKIQNVTSQERSANAFHEHHLTYRKGMNGHSGCRLAKKSGTCSTTHAVELIPLTDEIISHQKKEKRLSI